MITQTMVQPSSWIEGGIEIQKIRGLNLFKFTDELQLQLETLLERQKSSLLTPEEAAELAGMTELDRILTLMNAHIIAESSLVADASDSVPNPTDSQRLQQKIAIGAQQLLTGEYTDYTDETLPALFDKIRVRGQNRLDRLIECCQTTIDINAIISIEAPLSIE
jgi:hypothetical protein